MLFFCCPECDTPLARENPKNPEVYLPMVGRGSFKGGMCYKCFTKVDIRDPKFKNCFREAPNKKIKRKKEVRIMKDDDHIKIVKSENVLDNLKKHTEILKEEDKKKKRGEKKKKKEKAEEMDEVE